MIEAEVLLEPLRVLHNRIRDAVVAATEERSTDVLTEVHREEDDDTIYAIDVISEETLLPFFAELGNRYSFVLIAEGLPAGGMVFPADCSEAEAEWRIIMDPIDGTRGLMVQKRSAWILTGVAPNRGSETSLQDIVLAIQTEIPLVKQHLSDQLWAFRGNGAGAHRFNRLTGEHTPFLPRPSASHTIAHGYATVSRFFPGARDELASIDEEIVTGALGPVRPGKALCFEDQYVSSGGQLYELMVGHDRFIADLRPLMELVMARRGLRLGICCHPYDVCSMLIASELGLIVTDPLGLPLNAPLDTTTSIAWVGYANEHIRDEIEPLLQHALRARKLIP
jgi:fructose-1,6-bisphosphatase/inositol monophosphatase family enzyme